MALGAVANGLLYNINPTPPGPGGAFALQGYDYTSASGIIAFLIGVYKWLV